LNFFSLLKRKILYKLKKKINIDIDYINNKPLDGLLQYYGSDKANVFNQLNKKGHGFSSFYTRHLENLRTKKINILEVGSFAGASAAAFTKYFPHSNVYCFDVNISKFIYMSKKIHVYGLDINNEKKLKDILNKLNFGNNLNYFDIIIDDGSHYLSDILFTLKTLFQYVKQNGFYIIEDYKHPNYYNYNKNVEDILVDQLLEGLKEKKILNSNILSRNDQLYIQKNTNKIYTHKGKLEDSDICFIKKN
jgi:SAM-dependent methyltransferase